MWNIQIHLKKIRKLYRSTIKTSNDTTFFSVFLKAIYYYFSYSKLIIAHQNSRIIGAKNLKINGLLRVGVDFVGFMDTSDKTVLRVKGQLIFKENYSIGKGCRFDIGKDAIVSIGSGGFITANTKVIIMHRLTIGDNCAISWDCQFLDDDLHTIDYHEKKERNNEIIIGNNVWIGCGAKIYKGTIIPDGCVIAANTIVRGVFDVKNSLIGGQPARIIKSEVHWN